MELTGITVYLHEDEEDNAMFEFRNIDDDQKYKYTTFTFKYDDIKGWCTIQEYNLHDNGEGELNELSLDDPLVPFEVVKYGQTYRFFIPQFIADYIDGYLENRDIDIN